MLVVILEYCGTVKPVCNDHLYDKIYYLWLIQYCVLMKTEGTNPYPYGVAIEWLWSVDGVYYFHRPECTLQCHSDLMEWYWSGIGVRRKYAN